MYDTLPDPSELEQHIGEELALPQSGRAGT